MQLASRKFSETTTEEYSHRGAQHPAIEVSDQFRFYGKQYHIACHGLSFRFHGGTNYLYSSADEELEVA